MLAVITAGALAGLISAPHCALMCGPLGAYVCQRRGGMTRYQLARLVAYGLGGALAGAFGGVLIASLWSSRLALPLSWALAAAFLLAAYRAWPKTRAPRPDLVRLRARKPGLVARILRRAAMRPEALGGLSLLLPCAALWSGLLIASSSASALSGSLAMIAFALASGSGVLASGLLSRLGRAGPSRGRAALLALGAALVLLRPLAFAAPSSESEAAAHCPLHAQGLH